MSDTIHPDRDRPTAMTDHGHPPETGADSAPEVASAIPATRLGEVAADHAVNPAEGREAVFQLDDVTIAYSGRPAIRDVDLGVHRNLVTAFIGPSGCGKT